MLQSWLWLFNWKHKLSWAILLNLFATLICPIAGLHSWPQPSGEGWCKGICSYLRATWFFGRSCHASEWHLPWRNCSARWSLQSQPQLENTQPQWQVSASPVSSVSRYRLLTYFAKICFLLISSAILKLELSSSCSRLLLPVSYFFLYKCCLLCFISPFLSPSAIYPVWDAHPVHVILFLFSRH